VNIIRKFLPGSNIHPRRWLDGIFSYSRYIGYIKPRLINCGEEEYLARRKLFSKGWQPRLLRTPVGKRLLVLSPHPDDESIGAGGLLWAHRAISEIHFVIATKGEKGGALSESREDRALFRSRMAEARKKEFSKTASMLNARSCHYLDFEEGKIPRDSKTANGLRSIVNAIKPDVLLIPWFLDDRTDHRDINILYQKACSDFECMVLGYEVWSALEPNAIFDISEHLNGKISLIKNYETQLRTVDYVNYAQGLAKVRAFQYRVKPHRNGAAEAYLALPNREYCDLVRNLYLS
jgi:LmbE family N-acetylglucosaminyl deacetylase